MGLAAFVKDLVDPAPWLSITIENKHTGKSITLFHHQAQPSELEQALREVICGDSEEARQAIRITFSEAKWLSDHARSNDAFRD